MYNRSARYYTLSSLSKTLRARSEAQPGLAFPAKFRVGAFWSRFPAAFPLSECHAGLEQVCL
jgi:hypothetical protein